MIEPKCGKCGLVMTPTNSTIHPEYFLHDTCLPDDLRPKQVEQTHMVCDQTLALRAAEKALLGTSYERQFGPCWCNTVAGLYCVGQKRCKDCAAALVLIRKVQNVK